MRRDHGDELHGGLSVVVGQLALEGRGRRHHLSLFRPLGKALALRPQPWGRGGRLQHLFAKVRVRHDFNRHEVLVAAHMIAVVVSVDQVAERFIGDFPDGSDEVLRMNRPSRGIDHQHTVVADYDACVGNALVGDARAVPLDVGVDVGRELPKLGLPARDLRESRIRRRWYYRGRGCWGLRGLRPKARQTAFASQSQEKHEYCTRHAHDCFPATEPCDIRVVRLRHKILLES